MNVCPKCGDMLSNTYAYCPWCGEKGIPGPKCKKCHGELHPKFNSCTTCGQSVSGPLIKEKEPDAKIQNTEAMAGTNISKVKNVKKGFWDKVVEIIFR